MTENLTWGRPRLDKWRGKTRLTAKLIGFLGSQVPEGHRTLRKVVLGGRSGAEETIGSSYPRGVLPEHGLCGGEPAVANRMPQSTQLYSKYFIYSRKPNEAGAFRVTKSEGATRFQQ